MKLRLAAARHPVTALGPGRRVGIWVQGCSIQCPGCMSRDTWEEEPDKGIEVAAVLAWCRDVAGSETCGVTISGGEPFDQPDALKEFLEGLIDWRHESNGPLDFLCYSGYGFDFLKRQHQEILQLLDAIIPEPFRIALPREKLWRGSVNQPLIPLTELGRTRYAAFADSDFEGKGPFQVSGYSGRLEYIGVPDRGDLALHRRKLIEDGWEVEGESWRR